MKLNPKIWLDALAEPANLLILALFGANLILNIVSHSSFKVSAESSNWRGLLLWQVIGNLAGFMAVLTLTGLLRYIPLHVAHPISFGLAVIGVQVVGARLIFHEEITPLKWVGIFLIAAGVALIGGIGEK